MSVEKNRSKGKMRAHQPTITPIVMTYTLDEARELAALTTTIAANLKAIEESGCVDLEEMEKQTNNIAANLSAIEEADCGDLDELEQQTNNISATLASIEES